jgi:hypothetical protein
MVSPLEGLVHSIGGALGLNQNKSAAPVAAPPVAPPAQPTPQQQPQAQPTSTPGVARGNQPSFIGAAAIPPVQSGQKTLLGQ